MKVFKFGGGILQSAAEVKKIPGILVRYPEESLLIVVSAFGKTTNALEELIEARYYGQGNPGEILDQVIAYHEEIFRGLFPAENHPAHLELKNRIGELREILSHEMPSQYDEFYDRIICAGELLSSSAVHHALADAGVQNIWIDVRNILKTDSCFREASVDWQASQEIADEKVRPLLAAGHKSLIVTQGFIGSDKSNRATSLGREGSDYTASIFAYLLDASSVIIWKDVPGILNADPRHFEQTIKLDELSYAEATELAYYGAKVIHHKTVKPLQNKKIPLEVRSFFNPDEPGTLIHANANADRYIPSFIFKFNQVLISISNRDLSFVNELMFLDVFGLLSRYSIHLNMIQNSALTLTFCIDNHTMLEEMINELKNRYVVRYNQGLELVTIRHFNEKASEVVLEGKEVLLEQQNRAVVQYVIR